MFLKAFAKPCLYSCESILSKESESAISKEIIGYKGELEFDVTKPDSSMNRLLDCSKIHSLGWKHKIELQDGIKMMYKWYQTARKTNNVEVYEK